MNLINPSHRQFLQLPLEKKLDFVRYLLTFNQEQAGNLAQDEADRSARSWKDLRRQYHQLPCSRETRERRARLFLELGFQHKSICLLGDDDRVAVELMALGFSCVTVYDCDPKVLEDIGSKVPESAQSSLQLKQVDFTKPEGLRTRFADLVCFDPPYHKEGVQVFMETALACSRRQTDSKLIMMTIPLLFQNDSADWKDIETILATHDFHKLECRQGFNAYPLDPLNRLLLFSVSRLLERSEHAPGGMRGLRFFSDCLVWECRRALNASV
jgi:predicted methyltransferase